MLHGLPRRSIQEPFHGDRSRRPARRSPPTGTGHASVGRALAPQRPAAHPDPRLTPNNRTLKKRTPQTHGARSRWKDTPARPCGTQPALRPSALPPPAAQRRRADRLAPLAEDRLARSGRQPSAARLGRSAPARPGFAAMYLLGVRHIERVEIEPSPPDDARNRTRQGSAGTCPTRKHRRIGTNVMRIGETGPARLRLQSGGKQPLSCLAQPLPCLMTLLTRAVFPSGGRAPASSFPPVVTIWFRSFPPQSHEPQAGT